jgi:cell division protein FtsW (lipid II flippase)
MESFENQNPNQKPMSVKDWLITFLILIIPIVGLVMLFIYAFGENQNVHKQTWAKAQLIWLAIMIVLMFFLFMVMGSIFAAAMAGAAGGGGY